MSGGWEQALRAWSRALGFTFELRTNLDAAVGIGDWQPLDDCWVLRVNARCCAAFFGLPDDAELREALAMTVRVAGRGGRTGWREAVRTWMIDYLAAGGQAPAAAGTVLSGVELSGFEHEVPGYFVWIHLTQPRNADLPLDAKRAVEEVVSAAVGRGWLGWLPALGRADRETCLLYWPADQLDDTWTALIPADPDQSSEYLELLAVVQAVKDLLRQLETDAFVAAKAAVGARVGRPAELPHGLRTAVDAWALRLLSGERREVFAWGDAPVEQLFAHLPNEAAAAFLEIAATRAKQWEDALGSAEVAETLHGVIAANLNVSEAARLLYLHRNTLLHRIERIRQQTGYDVRNFRDALVLWIADVLRRKQRELDS